MSSSSYWCHSCHNVVRISSSPSLSCPSCGSGFVEAISSEPGILVISGNPSRRDLPGHGDAGLRELTSFGNSRSPSSARGFLRRLFRSSRGSRQASENPPASLLQVLEAASLLQRSRNTESRNDGISDGLTVSTEDIAGSALTNREVRSSMERVDADDNRDSRIGRPHDADLSPRPLDLFLQRLLAGVLQSGRSGSLPASKAAVAAMPTFKISKQSLHVGACDEHDEGNNECAVCKEVFEIGGEVREMPCKHFYHSNCILPWLELHSSCPLCRQEMPVDTEERASSSSRIEGTTGLPAGEPTVVFIGISGGDTLLFSFVFLGGASRNDPAIMANEEGEQSRQEFSIIEEANEGESDGERGESIDREVVNSSRENPSRGLESLRAEGRNFSESSIIEQITESGNSVGRRSEGVQGSVPQTNRNSRSKIPPVIEEESKPVEEMSVLEDVAGPSSSSNGTDVPREQRLPQMVTESHEGHPSGIRSRSFFSWFFRLATARHAPNSGMVEQYVESSESNEHSSIESGRNSDRREV